MTESKCDRNLSLSSSDVEKYKFHPGNLQVATKFGAKHNFLISPFIELSVRTNDFPFVEVRDGLPEGRGLFAKKAIPKFTFVCHYGGKLMTKDEGLQYWYDKKDFVYLYEFNFEQNGRNVCLYLNHSSESYTYGKFINHSRSHFNVIPKVLLFSDGKPEILFVSDRLIPEGDQILFDYGRWYEGVNKCVAGCRKCQFFKR